MRILTWNINGIRGLQSKMKQTLDELESDVICFQETKKSRDALDSSTAIVDGYTSYYSFCETKTGYSGVATYCKESVRPTSACTSLIDTNVEIGALGIDEMARCVVHLAENGEANISSSQETEKLRDGETSQAEKSSILRKHDREGRAVMTEHKIRYGDQYKGLVIINLYCPRAELDDEERHGYQILYHKLVQIKAEALLASGRHVIVTGDLNVSHRRIDHCKADQNPNFESRPSREWLDGLLIDVHHPDFTSCNNAHCRCGLPNNGNLPKTQTAKPPVPAAERRLVDLFRYYHPSRENAYTCWNTATGARKMNFGTRLDYILCEPDLPTKGCDINPEKEGSDHCPVWADFDVACEASRTIPKSCTKFFAEFAKEQTKLQFAVISKDNTLLPESEVPSAPLKRTSSSESSKAKKVKKEPTKEGVSLFKFFESRTDKTQPDSTGNASGCSVSSSSLDTDSQITTICDDDFAPKPMVSQWQAAFGKPPEAPKCKGHKLPCELKTVKKKGDTKGRKFWTCAKPEGKVGDPDARCNHFEWVPLRYTTKTSNSQSSEKKK